MPANTTKILAKTAWLICLLTGVVLGIKALHEPDIWWQLRTGEWIIANHSVPFKDIFSFTYNGTPWINVKWGFEVLMQCMAYLGGPDFVTVLQCFANVLILVFVYKTYKVLRKNINVVNSDIPSFCIIIICFLLLFTCAFRFNGRPEMSSHVFTAVFLFFIIRNNFAQSNKIYWLIPLQALWANLHEAYGTGMVMVVIAALAAWAVFLAGNTRQKRTLAPGKDPKAKPQWPMALTITALGVILAPALHPYGFEMITHPLEIFSQVGENKFTSELLSYSSPGYWQWEAYINIAFFGAGLIFFFIKNPLNVKSKWYQGPLGTFGFAYFIFFFVFFYLSLTAFRNIPFFIIIATPVIANGLGSAFDFLKNRFPMQQRPVSGILSYAFLIALGIGFYISVATGKFYKKIEGGHDNYGLKVNPLANPIGAANYIREHKLEGNCFSDYLVSSYLLWDLKPGFKSFIDLRDLDVFPAEFFNHFNALNIQPNIFPNVDKVAHFTYAVLFRREFNGLHKYFANSAQWKAVYADPVAVVYVKDSINTGTQNISRPVSFHYPPCLPTSSAAQIFSKIFWPFYNPDNDEKIDLDLIASSYYRNAGQLNAALFSAQKASQNNIANYSGYDMVGNIYLDIAANDTNKTTVQNFIKQANTAFNKAIDENKKDDGAYLGLGTASMRTNDIASAVSYFQEALKYNRKNFLVYVHLAECQNYYMGGSEDENNKYMDERIKYFRKAYALNADQQIRFYLGMAYGQRGDCDNCLEYLDAATLNYPGIPPPDRQLAKSLVLKCGR